MDRKPLVLIIEDEKEIAKFIDLELQAESYETVVTFDGGDGVCRSFVNSTPTWWCST
jgi:DNA-binding response OmpR family regulator